MPNRHAAVHDIERWCQDAGFVRTLARQLVADGHLADDIAQDAWLLALHGPAPRAGFRGWIAAIVRNVATSHHRSSAVRARHERSLAHRVNGDDPSATLAQLEAHELLIAAVRALAEPYRRAITQRYFEGLSPRAMAARNGMPVRTVHTHLQRALAQLRGQLAGRDPRGSALLLIAGMPAHATAMATTGATALAMTTKSKGILLVIAALLAAIPVFTWRLSEPAPAVTHAGPVAPAHRATNAAAVVEPTAERNLPTTAAEPSPLAAPPEPWSIHGFLLDTAGVPLQGLAVVLRAFHEAQPAATAITAMGGAFAFTLPDVRGGYVEVDDAAWTSIYRPVLWGNRDVGELTVIAGPASRVAGVVVDATGTPLAGARVAIAAELPQRAQFERSLERALPGEWVAETGKDGTFALLAPSIGGTRAQASKMGYRSAETPVLPHAPLRLVLTRGPMLVGRVVDEQGQPIEAAVFCHPAGTMSGHDGRFELDLTHVSSPWLVAAVQGHLPARLRCTGAAINDPFAWPQPIELQLAGKTLSISGTVTAADGTFLPSPSVRILDAECLVPGDDMSSIEFLARVHSRATADGAGFSEHEVEREPGQFEIGGLQNREYRLGIEHRPTLQWVESPPIRAGTHDVQLRLPAEPMWPAIAGTVVDRRGAHVSGASVWVERVDSATARVLSTEEATTGSDGRFDFGPLSQAACALCVQTPGTAHPTRFELARLSNRGQLQLVAPVQTRVRIQSQHDADIAAFLDAAEQPIAATITQGDRAWGAFDVPLTAGNSEVVTVPDNAVTLVLRRRGAELARVRVDLVPGTIHVLRP